MFQIVYSCDLSNPNEVHPYFLEEAKAMKAIGISADVRPIPGAKCLIYRGTIIKDRNNYPKDSRFINSYEHVSNYSNLSKYYFKISELTIETFFVDDLNDNIMDKINKLGWKKAFIKKDVIALEHLDEGKSIWPNTSFEEMKKLYSEMQIEGKYAIRKFIEKEIIDLEERYWVFNGNIYHRTNIIPDVVKEAAKRLDTMGSKYYTIDATPEFVVEVNPGESSDRHAVNSAELFASWIKKEFANR